MSSVRRLILACAAVLSLSGAHAADKGGTPVERPVLEVAQMLQAKLPALAQDGMCEVSREGNGWNFEIRVGSDQSSDEQVQVILRAAGDARSELRVQGVHVQSSLITSARKVDPALTKEWSDRILALVAKPG
jgi:hypothetical protein